MSDKPPGYPALIKPNNQPSPGPLGNTQGIIIPDTEPNPYGNSAPQIAATEQETGWWKRWGSAVTHGVLDVAGLIPVVGEVADGANALIYLAEGDKASAALSAAAMVPGLGMAATATKAGKRAVATVAEGAGKTAGRETTQQASQQGARKADGKGGGKDQSKKRNSKANQKGKCGEQLAKQDMIQEGFDQVVEVQNNSGHGVDLVGRNSKTGEVKVWEVKTTGGDRAPSLSKDQAKLGGTEYTADRLRRAVSGQGNYGKTPEAMINAEKAQDWIKKAERSGKTATYEKREVFIDDLSKGCAKNPSKPARSRPWLAKE